MDGANSLAAILPARERDEVGATWYAGTADAIYQNLDFLDRYDPEYVLILSGDHIYKMEYDPMLDCLLYTSWMSVDKKMMKDMFQVMNILKNV